VLRSLPVPGAFQCLSRDVFAGMRAASVCSTLRSLFAAVDALVRRHVDVPRFDASLAHFDSSKEADTYESIRRSTSRPTRIGVVVRWTR